ncbi:MAG: hypothetical protein DHS20C20_27380 [Ardenticatenaceae bacterium]|nr:MAG: hypothetical protein DHS20C20_27380 [Ardenticatenaceae bacterium]
MAASFAGALAVDITPLAEQSRVHSIMTSGLAVGIIVMSLLIGVLAPKEETAVP